MVTMLKKKIYFVSKSNILFPPARARLSQQYRIYRVYIICAVHKMAEWTLKLMLPVSLLITFL